ncbi:MAG TPA: DUF3515 domain-containing protein [Pseudonocardiaceae bacterium]|nr:DUF3515 domain-containing protein [Pseudonocardiaceae bacterium]
MTRPRLAVAVALSVLLAAAVVVLALTTGGQAGPGDQAGQSDQAGRSDLNGPGNEAAEPDGALALPEIAAPAAGSAECRSLLERLPAALTSPGLKATDGAGGTKLRQRSLAPPEPAGTAAWGRDANIVTLRCGIDRPAELTRTAPLLEVSGVRWLRIDGEGLSTWVAVDRAVYLGLTFGDHAGTGPLQDLSETITGTLPAQRVQPNP